MLESVPLFVTKRETAVTFFVLLVSLFISFGKEYYDFSKLKKELYYTDIFKVLNHYQKISKNDKRYDVFKLRSQNGFHFYTVRWRSISAEIGSKVKVKFSTKNIDFIGYLRGFFAPSLYLKVLKGSNKNFIKNYIHTQHKEKAAKEIFTTLFLATPLSKEIREQIQKLGISHLVAISGFHLGFLGTILFFIFSPVYRFFQDRYFPYRNRKFDIGITVFVILFFYMYMLDFTPSLLRAFVMGILGFYLYDRNIKIVSFENLLISILFIIVLFPKLLFSVSFWFSVSGVFYIFLFLYHFNGLNKIAIFIVLNFWVYFMMLPVVHYIFPSFTFLQLFSPLFSMAFVIFYPISLFLHLINQGGLLDGVVSYLMSLDSRVYEIKTPLWFLVVYIVLSIASIRSKFLALFCLFFSFGVFLI